MIGRPGARPPRHNARVRSVLTVALLVASAGFAPGQTPAPARVAVLGITSEIGPVERRLHDSRDISVRGVPIREGMLGSRRVAVGRTGTGKVHAAIAASVLIAQVNPDVVLFSGTAGAADPALDLGDVVIGTVVAHHDVGQQTAGGLSRRGPRHPVSGELDPVRLPAPDTLIETARRAARALALPPMTIGDSRRTPRIVEGVIVTGEMFVANTAQRDELRHALQAAAVEMEGAAFVQTCRYFGVRCLVVRSITDRADGQAAASYQAVRSAASENAAAVVTAIIEGLESR